MIFPPTGIFQDGNIRQKKKHAKMCQKENVDIASASHVQESAECSVKAKFFTEIQTCIGASANKQNNTHDISH